MTAAKHRKDGLILLFFGAVIFLSIGIAWRHIALIQMGDFKVVYYSARCLLEHGDPYSQRDVLRVYRAEGRERLTEPPSDLQVKTRFFYPPSAFALTAPVVSLGFKWGAIVWTILLAAGLIAGAIAAWDLAADISPVMSGALAGLLLMNSFWLYMIGNAAAVAVGLCVIAVWSFYRERFVPAGLLCMALSLAVKPNDSGLIWLLLLFAGSVYRKRALQSLGVLLLLGLPMVFWVSHVSPHWLPELKANMASFSGVGGSVDPAATGLAGRNMDAIVHLQTVISMFFPEPRIFDLITYAVCGPIFAIWLWALIFGRRTANGFWLAIAVATPLTMLPMYHYQHDVKLLLLVIPGCAVLWARRGCAGWAAFLITAAGIVVNGDIFMAARVSLTRNFVVPQPNFLSRLVTVLLTRQSALALLAMSIFFLWAFVQEARSSHVSGKPGKNVSGLEPVDVT